MKSASAKIIGEMVRGPIRLVATSDGAPISLRFRAYYDGQLCANFGQEAAQCFCAFVKEILERVPPIAVQGVTKAQLMAGR